MSATKFNDATTPAILRFDYDSGAQWKVSPCGPDDPDTDAVWCDSRAEAQRVAAVARYRHAREMLTRAQERRRTARQHIDACELNHAVECLKHECEAAREGLPEDLKTR